MNLIDKTFFYNPPCEIAFTDESNGYSNELTTRETSRINSSIAIYQGEYLSKVMGLDMAELFISEVSKEVVDEKWALLRDKIVDSTNKISPIANYVHFHYLRNNELGIINRANAVIAKAENAQVTSNYPLMQSSWSAMITLNNALFYWLYKNYKEYETEDVKFNFNGWIELLEGQNYGI